MNMTEHLVTLRKKAGLSQGDVAEQLNVSRQAVSRWETGLALPSTDNLTRLSMLYGVSLDDLIGHHPVHPAEVSVPTQEKTPQKPDTATPQITVTSPRLSHTKGLIIAMCILCTIFVIVIAMLLHYRPSEKEPLDFSEVECESTNTENQESFSLGW